MLQFLSRASALLLSEVEGRPRSYRLFHLPVSNSSEPFVGCPGLLLQQKHNRQKKKIKKLHSYSEQRKTTNQRETNSLLFPSEESTSSELRSHIKKERLPHCLEQCSHTKDTSHGLSEKFAKADLLGRSFAAHYRTAHPPDVQFYSQPPVEIPIQRGPAQGKGKSGTAEHSTSIAPVQVHLLRARAGRPRDRAGPPRDCTLPRPRTAAALPPPGA